MTPTYLTSREHTQLVLRSDDGQVVSPVPGV